MWSNSWGNVGVFTQGQKKTQMSVLFFFYFFFYSSRPLRYQTNYLIPRRNVLPFRNVYLNWPCFALRNIRSFKPCFLYLHANIHTQIFICMQIFTQWLQGKRFIKDKPSACICVFPPPFCLSSVKDDTDYRTLVGSIPEATVTGHCVLLSRRWPFPACPAWLCRAPRWTCPCWVSWTCWRRWSGSPGCGLTSFPLAQSSLEPKHPNKTHELACTLIKRLCRSVDVGLLYTHLGSKCV